MNALFARQIKSFSAGQQRFLAIGDITAACHPGLAANDRYSQDRSDGLKPRPARKPVRFIVRLI
jgi:hypothetical protein